MKTYTTNNALHIKIHKIGFCAGWFKGSTLKLLGINLLDNNDDFITIIDIQVLKFAVELMIDKHKFA